MKSKALLGFVLCYSTNPELYIKVMRIQGITADQNSFDYRNFLSCFLSIQHQQFQKGGGGGADTMRSIH